MKNHMYNSFCFSKLFLFYFLFCFGCGSFGGASFLIQSPIESQCNQRGLKSCEIIAEGIVKNIEGNLTEGNKLIAAGVSKNSTESLKSLVDILNDVKTMPGVDSFADKIDQVISLINQENSTTVENKTVENKEEESIVRFSERWGLKPRIRHSQNLYKKNCTLICSDYDCKQIVMIIQKSNNNKKNVESFSESNVNCNPPYSIGRNGIRIPKTQCNQSSVDIDNPY